MALMGIVKFFAESGEMIVLGRCRAINAKVGALREHAVEHHDGPAIAVKKRMAMCKISHDLAGLRGRELRSHVVCPVDKRLAKKGRTVLRRKVRPCATKKERRVVISRTGLKSRQHQHLVLVLRMRANIAAAPPVTTKSRLSSSLDCIAVGGLGA
jgi:hypothetical protein